MGHVADFVMVQCYFKGHTVIAGPVHIKDNTTIENRGESTIVGVDVVINVCYCSEPQQYQAKMMSYASDIVVNHNNIWQ